MPRSRLALPLVAFALACSAPAWAAGVLPEAATPVQREQAQSRFARGRDMLSKNQYDQALVEFRASHDIVASPNTRLEIARCLRSMGKLVAAYAELGRASVEAKEQLAQDSRYKRAYDSAIAERTEIEPQLGFVTLTIQNATDDTKVVVGGEEIRRAAWNEPAPVAPSATDIVVTTPGHEPVVRSITLAAGQKTALTIDASSGATTDGAVAAPGPPPDVTPSGSGPSLRTWAYVSGGVGAAGFVAAGIFGVLAKSTYDDLNGACHGGPCPSSKTGEISSGKSQETVANVGLGVGIAGLAVGAVLFVLSMPKSAPSPASAVFIRPSWGGLQGSW
jgi:hypothetical protein